MEMHCGRLNPPFLSKRTSKISLEEYLDFVESRKQLDLTVNSLNQIISIHGFKKLKEQKKVLIDALNSMDLVHPSRSTINDDDVSSCAFISMDEIKKDMFDLNWIECSVTSLQTLNSVNHASVLQNSHASTSKSKPKKRKSSSKRKVPELKDVEGDKAIAVIATDVTGSINVNESFLKGPEPACSVAVNTKNSKRKKKKKSGNALVTVSNSTDEFSKFRGKVQKLGDVESKLEETKSTGAEVVKTKKRMKKSVSALTTDFLFY